MEICSELCVTHPLRLLQILEECAVSPEITRRADFRRNYVIENFAVRQTIGANSLIARSNKQQENF